MARPENVFSAGDPILAEEINENFEEVWAGVNIYGESSEGSDAYAITIDGIEAYSEGMVVAFKADVANTGACSLNVSGIGAIPIKKNVNGSMVDLDDYDIEAGQIIHLIYDGTQFQYVNFKTKKFVVIQSSRTASAGSGDQEIPHSLGCVPKKITIYANTQNGAGGYRSSIGNTWYINGGIVNIGRAIVFGSDGGSLAGSIILVGHGSDSMGGAMKTNGTDASKITITWTKYGSGVDVSFQVVLES